MQRQQQAHRQRRMQELLQPLHNQTITSVGTLTGLTTSGVITGTNTTASTSSATGALIVAGGAGIAKDSFINGMIIGTRGTASATAVGVNALSEYLCKLHGGWIDCGIRKHASKLHGNWRKCGVFQTQAQIAQRLV
jgi:hypothetical protein